jgi:MarR family transcriptional regulator, organic hydroperoxide resistance regulator
VKDDPILAHWRDAVPEDRLAHLIKDTTRALARSLQVRLAQHDIAFGHWPFLRVLWERDGLTQKQLADEVGVMESTTTTALKAMQNKGYIERRQQGGNAKNLHIYLTPAGQTLKVSLVPEAETVNALALKGLSKTEVKQLRTSLLVCINNLALDPLL